MLSAGLFMNFVRGEDAIGTGKWDLALLLSGQTIVADI